MLILLFSSFFSLWRYSIFSSSIFFPVRDLDELCDCGSIFYSLDWEIVRD